MTSAELIATIRNEIEKRITDNTFGAKLELIDILAWLDTLESEKLMQEGLEEEINRTYHDGSVTDTSDLDHNSYENIARHFAQWGTEHLADARKMIEPEKKEGRTDCSPQGEVPNHSLATQSYENIPKDLEEAAKKYAHCPFTDDDGNFHEDAIDGTAYHDFIAGAEWQKEQYHFFNKAWADDMQAELDRNYENGKLAMKEQMMNEAVEGVLVDNVDGTQEICLHGNRYGNKVRIIIVKEDSHE